MAGSNKIWIRVAGAIVIIFALGLAALALVVGQRISGAGAILLMLASVGVAGLCGKAGYLRLRDRSDRQVTAYLMEDWNKLALCFYALALLFAVFAVRKHWIFTIAACAVALGYSCGVAKRRMWHLVPNPLKVLPPETSLLTIQGFAPRGFRQGIEILNDQRTPMEFFVKLLRTHLGLPPTMAIPIAARLQKEGGVLLPCKSLNEAQRIAGAMITDARGNKRSLLCRAVSVE